MAYNILKHFRNPGADAYVFQPARELNVGEEPPLPPPEDSTMDDWSDSPPDSLSGDESGPLPDKADGQDSDAAKTNQDSEDPFRYAAVQKEAMLRQARQEVDDYKAQALEEFETELEDRRAQARSEGYSQGYAEGMADAMTQARLEREQLAAEQVKAVENFLTAAARQRDKLLDDSREELKELALTIAEKIIQVSLRNSSDIILRMVEAATDTHKRCEWAHIYVADCDVRGKAYTVPELAAALTHISDRVRIIPMADDESGTCIVELPDVIYDASVSTQMSNIREVLNSAGPD